MTTTQYNLAAVHEAIAASVPDRECIVFRDRRLTFTDVTARSRQLAHVIHGAGLGARPEGRVGLAGHESHEDHVAIYAYNGNEYLETLLAAFKARVAPVNVNYRYVAGELHQVLSTSRAKAIVYHSALAPTLAAVLPDLPELRVLLQIADDDDNDLLPGAQWYEDALAGASAELPSWAGEWSPDDLYMVYTGGTTGSPKGVLWRQADIYRTAMGGRSPGIREPWPTIQAAADAAAAAPRTIVCPTPPFMHGAGHWVALMAMNQGATVVIQEEVTRLDPADICRVVEREGVTYLQVVGDAFARPIVEEMETGRYDLSSITTVLSGGAALSAPIKVRLLQQLPGVRVVESVGSSEGGGQGLQVTTAGDGTVSTGTFSPSEGSVVVSSDLGRVLSPGDDAIGWMAKRGDDIPLGYLDDPNKTARTFPVVAGERMSVPGDRARWLADGTIELLGRDSTTINSGGEKIFAEEVEAAISAHADVYDVVVTSRASERWGQELVAIVRLREGAAPSESDLAEEAARHVARYKLPKAWVFVDAIERSPAGKAAHRWATTIAAEAAR
jgi:acyl-CoA synthetase (AMP-forming)/AMP-acid ligase II